MAPPPTVDRHDSAPRKWLWVVAAVWLTAVTSGLYVVWAYENKPGAAANAPSRWPVNTMLAPATDRPTLLLISNGGPV